MNTSTMVKFELTDESYRCKCGCKMARGDNIPIFCDLAQLDVLGSGVILFFLFQKELVAGQGLLPEQGMAGLAREGLEIAQ